MATSRETRARRKAAGLCVDCGRMPSRPGRTLCVRCALIHSKAKAELWRTNEEYRRKCNERQAASRAAAAAEGRCIRCGAPTDGVHLTCCECRAELADRRVAKMQDGGFCSSCLSPLPAGWKLYTCPACAARNREARRERLAAGLCIQCGARPARPGRKTCTACAEAKSAAARTRHERDIRNGRCIECHRKLDAEIVAMGRRRCPECLERRRAVAARRREARRRAMENRTCTRCLVNPAEPGRAFCAACNARRNRQKHMNALRRATAIETGRCTGCNARLDAETVAMGLKRCPECREKARAYNARRLAERQAAAGGVLCTRCHCRPAEPGRATCTECREERAARRAENLENGICTRCGHRPVEPGYTFCAECGLAARQAQSGATPRRYTRRHERDRRKT